MFVVTATHTQRHETTLDLTISGEVVHTTDEHPFLTETGWVEAGQLTIGDEVLAADGSTGIVEAVIIINEPQTMYNLTVALAATYVVGVGQWVVHNVKCTLYRGTDVVERVNAAKKTGYIMSDAVFGHYATSIGGGLDTAIALARSLEYGTKMHQKQLSKWGSIGRYAELHAKSSSDIKTNGLERTFISFFTLDLDARQMNQVKAKLSPSVKALRKNILEEVKPFRWQDNLFEIRNVEVDKNGIFDNRTYNGIESEILVPIAIKWDTHVTDATLNHFRKLGLI